MKVLIAIFALMSFVACQQGGGDGAVNTGEPTTTEPADNVLNPGDEISMTMGFGVDAQQVNADNISFSCQGEGIEDGMIPIDVVYNSSARKINIVPKQALVSGTSCDVVFSAELNAMLNKAQQSGLATGEYLGRVGGNRPPQGAYEYQNATPYVGVYTPPGQEPSTAPAELDPVTDVSDQVYGWSFTVSSSASGVPPVSGGADPGLPGVGEGLGVNDEEPPVEEPPAEEPPAETAPTPTCTIAIDQEEGTFDPDQPINVTLKGEHATKGEITSYWSADESNKEEPKTQSSDSLPAEGFVAEVVASELFEAGYTKLTIEAYTENDSGDKSTNCGKSFNF